MHFSMLITLKEVSRLHFFELHCMDGMQRRKFNGFLKGAGLEPIISDAHVKFIYPLEFPNKIVVGATQHVEAKHQRVVAEGYATVVSYNYDTKNSKT